jgi:hypothetical protein
MDKISAYIALLFLAASSDFELVQDEFYSELIRCTSQNRYSGNCVRIDYGIKTRIEAVLFVTAKAVDIKKLPRFLMKMKLKLKTQSLI